MYGRFFSKSSGPSRSRMWVPRISSGEMPKNSM